ncbi:unnamed protein product [Clavelina lepadiformis]|uniref:Glutaredoxin domain-containing protein n=1 Tax=Clavelina lepadiformis TaxID=159417 RepID=A0ABP0FAS9_CLALP
MVNKTAAKQLIEENISSNKVMVFSKSWCPYCKRAKDVIAGLYAQYATMELDQRDDEDTMQDVLLEMTGGRSVPRVFINGKFVGGCDETLKLHAKGMLIKLIQA